jgi:1-aminocyclopropane-1-carboxylate deaminase/D-cysteine desulfhydrase-like pyridoxal-dependent ACC family enzyme
VVEECYKVNNGVLLDPIYTGRAFYGLMDLIKKNKLKPGFNISFLHNGGIDANLY